MREYPKTEQENNVATNKANRQNDLIVTDFFHRLRSSTRSASFDCLYCRIRENLSKLLCMNCYTVGNEQQFCLCATHKEP